jgi:hypothetical protein
MAAIKNINTAIISIITASALTVHGHDCAVLCLCCADSVIVKSCVFNAQNGC